MPNRILRDWTDSPAVNTLTDSAEKFFVRLIMKADDFGRYHANPKMLRAMLYPLQLDLVREINLDRLISECEKASLVRLYEIEGRPYLEVSNFGQRIRDGVVSKFPPPPPYAASRGVTRRHAALVVDGGVDEGVGVGGNPPPAFLEIPTLAEAIERTAVAGIDPRFVTFVYEDWSARSGKDAAGNVVAWLPYVTKRWSREQVEWKTGTHRGTKGGNPTPVRLKSRPPPPLPGQPQPEATLQSMAQRLAEHRQKILR